VSAPRSSPAAAEESRRAQAQLEAALGTEYEIRHELGAGSVSRVFLARDRELGRLVAIKVLLPGPASDDTTRKRFEREARASASLQHPSVVDVYRYGRLPDDTPYLVMRFVKGRTMEDRLAAEGPLGIEKARTVLGSVASALAAAHGRGIVHRDVRPGNVLWDEERNEALLADFGIAGILATAEEHGARLTMAGQTLGNPGYQAPEQLLDEPVSELADVYAFGITAFELLTGEKPWPGSDAPAAIIRARLTGEPRDLSSLRPDVDPALSDLIRRCLAREPRHRPSAIDLVHFFENGGEVSDARTSGPDAPADLHELMKRRVPQVILVAIGLGWGLMTLVDQLVSREILPDVAYRLSLVFALSGIAASTVIAWFHGQRGRQEAPLVEYVLLGLIALGWLAASTWVLLA
jgi:serine/threonine protein kinase